MKPATRHIILEEASSFQFFTDDTGAHFLDVLCGGFAMFSVCIQLTEDELSRYGDFGDYFVQKLALVIAHAPETFAHRNVPLT